MPLWPEDGSREKLMEEIGFLAESYTPEWRFSPLKPDLGTALACLFAKVLEEAFTDYSRVPELLYHEFMAEAGCCPKEASPSRGFMAFGLVKPEMPEVLLPAGWGVVSRGREGSVSMETEEAVYVSAASVRLLAGPRPEGEEGDWTLVFDRPLSKGVLSLLFIVEGQAGGGCPGLVWEYYGGGGWTCLTVEDGTEGLDHTGIVRFAATSDFRCMDRQEAHGWAVRVRGPRLPGQPGKVYMNAAPVRASEPGRKGNIDPGARHRLKKTAGFVSAISNPLSFSGGNDKEPWDEAAHRTAAGLRHRFRAVTSGDYEQLVRACCRDVEKVKCFSGYDSAGGKKWGEVTVVVLLKDFRERQPCFFQVKEELGQFFRDKASAALLSGSGPSFVSPRFIRMDVRAVLCVRDLGLAMEVRAAAARTLERFMDPSEGGYDKEGWGFGILPGHMQLKNCLQHVPGVSYVRQLTCRCMEPAEDGWKETEWEAASLFPWCLPLPGILSVDVEAE